MLISAVCLLARVVIRELLVDGAGEYIEGEAIRGEAGELDMVGICNGGCVAVRKLDK